MDPSDSHHWNPSMTTTPGAPPPLNYGMNGSPFGNPYSNNPQGNADMSPATALGMSASPLRNPYSSGPQAEALMPLTSPLGMDGLPLRNPHINNSFGSGPVPYFQPLGMNNLPPSNPYLSHHSNGTLMAPGPPRGTPGSSTYNPYTNTQYISTQRPPRTLAGTNTTQLRSSCDSQQAMCNAYGSHSHNILTGEPMFFVQPLAAIPAGMRRSALPVPYTNYNGNATTGPLAFQGTHRQHPLSQYDRFTGQSVVAPILPIVPEGMDGSPLSVEDLSEALEYYLFSKSPSCQPVRDSPRHNAFARKALSFLRRTHGTTYLPESELEPEIAAQMQTRFILSSILIRDPKDRVISALSTVDKRTAFRMLHNRVNAICGTANIPFHKVAGDNNIELAMKLSEAFMAHPSGAILMGETEVGEAEEIRTELEETYKAIGVLKEKLLRSSLFRPGMDHRG